MNRDQRRRLRLATRRLQDAVDLLDAPWRLELPGDHDVLVSMALAARAQELCAGRIPHDRRPEANGVA
jgi:hypothetical protein